MACRYAALLSCLIAHALFGATVASAQATNPHELYEQRCSRCHEHHAGEFVHNNLERTGEKIVGRSTSQELGVFLSRGHGRIAPREVNVMVAHLTFILESGALFREHCFICHGRAVELARSKLVIREDKLVGRYTGCDIETFLESHGRLEGNEVATVLQMLERQLITYPAD